MQNAFSLLDENLIRKRLPDGVMVAHVILVHIVGVRIPIGESEVFITSLFLCLLKKTLYFNNANSLFII